MIKRLIEYLIIKRKIEYIQYENSLKSNNVRNCINYSTLKTISIKISTNVLNINKNNIKKMSFDEKLTIEKNEMFLKLMNVFNEHNENNDFRLKYEKMSFDKNMIYKKVDDEMTYEQNDKKTIHEQNNKKSTHEQTNKKIIKKKLTTNSMILNLKLIKRLFYSIIHRIILSILNKHLLI